MPKRTAGTEARPAVGAGTQKARPIRRADLGRHRLGAVKTGGDGIALHTAGRALRKAEFADQFPAAGGADDGGSRTTRRPVGADGIVPAVGPRLKSAKRAKTRALPYPLPKGTSPLLSPRGAGGQAAKHPADRSLNHEPRTRRQPPYAAESKLIPKSARRSTVIPCRISSAHESKLNNESEILIASIAAFRQKTQRKTENPLILLTCMKTAIDRLPTVSLLSGASSLASPGAMIPDGGKATGWTGEWSPAVRAAGGLPNFSGGNPSQVFAPASPGPNQFGSANHGSVHHDQSDTNSLCPLSPPASTGFGRLRQAQRAGVAPNRHFKRPPPQCQIS